PVLAYVDGTPASDVAAAIQDLYGYELRPVREREWSLGRPDLAPARNGYDLHAKMRRCLPPAAWRLWLRPGALSRGQRYLAQWGPLLAELNRAHGPSWATLRISDLDSAQQQALANIVFDDNAAQAAGNFLELPDPPPGGCCRSKGTSCSTAPLARGSTRSS